MVSVRFSDVLYVLAVARSFQLMKVLVRYMVDLSVGQNPTAVKTHADYRAWAPLKPSGCD